MMRRCQRCKRFMTASVRADAAYCSDACKQAAYRQRRERL